MLYLIFGAAIAFSQTPDWRVLRDQTPSAMLIDQLTDLAHALPGPEKPARTYEIKRRLYVGLSALQIRPTDTVRRYVNRITAHDRQTLSDGVDQIIRRLTDREPHLRTAVAAARRIDHPELPPQTWRERLHDRALLAWAKWTKRVLFVKTPEAARDLAPAVVRLERLLRAGTWTPAPLTPADELIEVLQDWSELDWPVVESADPQMEKTDALTRYFVAKWFAIRDLKAFAKTYRERMGAAERRVVAEATPQFTTLVERVESPEVVAQMRRLREKPLAKTPEAELGRNLRNLGLAALGALFAKWSGPKIEEDLAKNRAVEARALHWLKIEEIMRGDERNAIVAGCDRALASFSRPGEDVF